VPPFLRLISIAKILPAHQYKSIQDGLTRISGSIFYDNYVLVGPKIYSDVVPKGIGKQGAKKTFDALAANRIPFVSRADGSAEFVAARIWKLLDRKPWEEVNSADWYWRVQGLAFPEHALQYASFFGAFVFTDLSTWLRNKKNAEQSFEVYCTGGADGLMLNPSVAIVRDTEQKRLSPRLQGFLDYLKGPRAQELIIGRFGSKEFGRPIFLPGRDEELDYRDGNGRAAWW